MAPRVEVEHGVSVGVSKRSPHYIFHHYKRVTVSTKAVNRLRDLESLKVVEPKQHHSGTNLKAKDCVLGVACPLPFTVSSVEHQPLTQLI